MYFRKLIYKTLKNPIQLTILGMLLLWIVFGIVELFGPDPLYIPTLILLILSIGTLAIVAFFGPSRFSSRVGKMLIFAGSFMMISLFIQDGFSSLATGNSFVRVSAIATGLFLERISPHERLKPWMFLTLVTKVQALLVGTFVTLLVEKDVDETLPIMIWWISVLFLVALIPLLIKRMLFPYQLTVLTQTIIMAPMIVYFFLTTSPALSTHVVASAILIWPAITTRLIGKNAFTQTSKRKR
jgi:hypothetical protein